MAQTMTYGEKLWLYRRRLKLSQTQMGKRFGLTREHISNLELGKINGEPIKTIITALTFKERAILARRRKGWGMHETARRIGVSHVTLLKMERTGDPVLMDFWKHRGFTIAV